MTYIESLYAMIIILLFTAETCIFEHKLCTIMTYVMYYYYVLIPFCEHNRVI